MIINDNIDVSDEDITYDILYRDLSFAIKQKLREKCKIDTAKNLEFKAKYKALMTEMKRNKNFDSIRLFMKFLGSGLIGISAIRASEMNAGDLATGFVVGSGILGGTIAADIVSHMKYKQCLDKLADMLLEEIKRGDIYQQDKDGNIVKSYLINGREVDGSIAKACIERICEDMTK
jgi:hypothetical protein